MTRSGADVGAGLARARPARTIPAGERIHVIGVAGAGASAAASLAHFAGARVSACDSGGPSPYTSGPALIGLPMEWRHGPDHVIADGASLVDRLAVTKALTSIDPDHSELLAARGAGIPVEPWQQLVADVAESRGQRLVAVTGTHGKSTCAGWLVHLLTSAGRDPAACVGALLPARLTGGVPATARWGRGDTFVVEADEYAGNFDPFRPSVAVLLNVEWDHPDVFADEDAVVEAFARWTDAPGIEGRTVVANVRDAGVRHVLERMRVPPQRLVRVALATVGEAGAGEAGAGEADLSGQLGEDGILSMSGPLLMQAGTLDVPLRLAGGHNAANALAVAAASAVLGVEAGRIGQGLATFEGVGRRLELKGEPGGITVLDDYGHHPTAIAATLAAVRARYPGRRIWAVYEPLTYHRTAAMLERFADVLATADQAVIADIWAGRDPDTSITSADRLATAIRRRGHAPATAPGSVEATADHLAGRVKPPDVVLVMGGGRSYVIAERLLVSLAERWPQNH